MSSWTDPITLNYNPDDPVTAEWGAAAIENPITIAIGDREVSAVPVFGGALEIFAGVADVPTSATFPTFTAIGSETGLARVMKVTVQMTTSASGTVQARFSANGGVNWGSAQSLFAVDADVSGTAVVFVDLVSGRVLGTRPRALPQSGGAANKVENTVTVPADCNMIELRRTGGGPMTAIVEFAGRLALP
jgi:hypothetical protein